MAAIKSKIKGSSDMKILIKIIYLFITLVVLTFLMSCSDPVNYDNNTINVDYTTGQIRFIHSASSTGEIDIAYKDLDGTGFYSYVSAVGYGTQYGYSDFRTGEREFRIYIPNTNIFISDCIFNLEEDQKYSLIAYDYEAALDTNILVLNDTLANVDQGYVLLRLIHLGADLPAITITDRDSSKIIADLDHLKHSRYLSLPARTYNFDLKLKSSGEIVKALSPITLQSSQTYTAIISGSSDQLTPIELNMKLYIDTSIQ